MSDTTGKVWDGAPQMTDPKSLRSIAEGATAVSWFTPVTDEVCAILENRAVVCIAAVNPMGELNAETTAANAKFIATFDPPTALSLLDRITHLESREGVLVEALGRCTPPCCLGHVMTCGRPYTGVDGKDLEPCCVSRRALHLTEETGG